MSEPSPRSSRARWTVICVVLAPAVTIPLLVPIYDRQTPELLGFPFFFWFQLAVIPIAAALTTLAYVLAKRADVVDREVHGLRPLEGRAGDRREDRGAGGGSR